MQFKQNHGTSSGSFESASYSEADTSLHFVGIQELQLLQRMPRGESQERILQFIEWDTELSGNALNDKIINLITQKLQPDLQDCRGQCYDGAGNMAGKVPRVSSRVLSVNPLALYTHCSSHRLNLCVASSCQIQSVRNMMENVTKLCNFLIIILNVNYR